MVMLLTGILVEAAVIAAGMYFMYYDEIHALLNG
mgnify:CR=1 FL=1